MDISRTERDLSKQRGKENLTRVFVVLYGVFKDKICIVFKGNWSITGKSMSW